MKWTLDVALRNREESERYWNEPLGLDTRLQRIFVMCIAILAIPIELVAELILVFLGFVSRYGSLLLWVTNPIKKEQTQTGEDEESL